MTTLEIILLVLCSVFALGIGVLVHIFVLLCKSASLWR
jgi:hypothetical protein